MSYLVFRLRGLMASWGEVAVGEHRGSDGIPTTSALAGLLCAALGLRREQESALQAVHSSYLFAVGVCSEGVLLRDYHTAQVPSRSLLKGSKHVTRKDEIAFPRHELNTMLSMRDHRQEVDHLVAVQAQPGSPYTLEELRHALLQPVFVLYLGRKSCPPCAPLHPLVVDGQHVLAAFSGYATKQGTSSSFVAKLAWPEGMNAGVPADLSQRRQDRLTHRGAWQYGDRVEHVAMLRQEGA
ncbi:type I-E CRISPR-associated protein Cas5/CasD [Aquabacterium sp.]|uniref:type I-E CRISPR-associated protein Cas5/CasD n=1 Tax=Aquabacterium sp. TaxID=1872578 RepID=UPI0035C75E66